MTERREDNQHLALPFFVKELRGQIPDIYPGELGLIGAASGDGKTNIMGVWHAQVQAALEESKRRGDGGEEKGNFTILGQRDRWKVAQIPAGEI